MITLQQKTDILRLVDNLCMYEGRISSMQALLSTAKDIGDKSCIELAEMSLKRAEKSGTIAGTHFIEYLDKITNID